MFWTRLQDDASSRSSAFLAEASSGQCSCFPKGFPKVLCKAAAFSRRGSRAWGGGPEVGGGSAAFEVGPRVGMETARAPDSRNVREWEDHCLKSSCSMDFFHPCTSRPPNCLHPPGSRMGRTRKNGPPKYVKSDGGPRRCIAPARYIQAVLR